VAVAVSQGALLATAFHPELTADLRWHAFFWRGCVQALERNSWSGGEIVDVGDALKETTVEGGKDNKQGEGRKKRKIAQPSVKRVDVVAEMAAGVDQGPFQIGSKTTLITKRRSQETRAIPEATSTGIDMMPTEALATKNRRVARRRILLLSLWISLLLCWIQRNRKSSGCSLPK
jgi:hypothetical protein